MSKPLLNKSINRKKQAPPGCLFPEAERGWVAPFAVMLVVLTAPLSASATPEEHAETAAPPGNASAGAPEAHGPVVLVRPHAGVGWASAYNRSGNALALHAGGRLLFPAPLSPKVDAKFGLEATYLQLDLTGREIFEERYAAVGVALEMTVVRGFNLGVGTLGYIGVGGTDRNPFGVVTNLGWEPLWTTRVRPYLTMRSEWIFDRATYSVLSLSAGITFGI